MKLLTLLFVHLCFWNCCFAQNLSIDSGQTRALVIGISDYQDEDIPDLRFAHRDAGAFAGWLASEAGGNVPESQLILLVNEEATIGKVIDAMGWLVEESKEGDQVIFYFSGHGDVESITSFQRGYLLTHNAPSRNYMAGGTLPLGFLRDVTTTLTNSNVKVTVVTDACRSGKLAGSSINGAQYTGSQLAVQFSTELKILSCQPEEFSHEGEQWGAGHGVFTYNLVEGLIGFADRNLDLQVTLSEMDRYLEEKVSQEVAPLSQTPMTMGNKNALLSLVNPQLLSAREKRKYSELSAFKSVANRGFALQDFAQMDSSIQEIVLAFQRSLANKVFFEPPAACAEKYYQALMQESELKPFQASFRRQYAAALQDDAQDALNSLLKVDILKIDQSRLVQAKNYSEYPKYLGRAAKLLGQEHYFYSNLKARQYFFEGMLLWMRHFFGKVEGQMVIDKYRKSLEYESFAPHTHLHMSLCFSTMIVDADSMHFHAMKAAEQAPTWVLPYVYLAYYKTKIFQQYEESKKLIDKAMEMDSQHIVVWNALAAWHFHQGQYEPVIQYSKKVLSKDSSYSIAWYNLGIGYYFMRQYGAAEKALLNALRWDSTQFITYHALGTLYYDARLWEKSEKMLLKSLQLNADGLSRRIKLGAVYYRLNRLEDSEKYFTEAYNISPTDLEICFNLACVSARLGKTNKALDYLEQGLKNGERNYKDIITDDDLSTIRTSARFKSLMQSYFPDKVKD